MTNTGQAFKNAYSKLKRKDNWKFSIELYHYDANSEPFYFSESLVEKVLLDYINGSGLDITIMTKEISISFNEANFLAHTDENYVSFGSRYDNGTHCVIEFC